jgi:hypothetical protein
MSGTAQRPAEPPWGVRTASFTDPGGHIWEVAQELSRADVLSPLPAIEGIPGYRTADEEAFRSS